MKSVLVTGGATGIGKAIAYKFASAGYNVAITYNKSKKEAEELLKDLKGKSYSARIFQADITCSTARKSLVKQVVDAFSGIDVLVNNAGIDSFGVVQDVTESLYDKVFDVNFKSAFFLTNEVLPYMLSEKSGSIINVSSIWGISGASCEVLYSATKSAMIGYTKALSKELGLSGITVNAVAPGVIDTKMNARLNKEDIDKIISDTPLSRIGLPDDVASAVYYLATEDFITGQVIVVDGGFSGV